MRPKSTGTISISLKTSQSTKVTQIFLPQVQTFSLQLRGTGDPSTEFHRDPSESPTSNKKPDGHQNPCRNHQGGYKIQHSGVSWERKGEGKTPLEQRDTKSEQTDTFLGIFQEFHKPKPRTQPENPWPRGEKNQGGHGDSRAQESCWRQHF